MIKIFTVLYFIALLGMFSVPSSYLLISFFCLIGILIGCLKIIGKPRRLVIIPMFLSVASFAIMPFFVSWIEVFLFSIFSSTIFYFLLFFRQKIESKKQDRRQHELLRGKMPFSKPLIIAVLPFCFLSIFLILKNSNISFAVALSIFFIIFFISCKEILEFNTGHSQYTLITALVLGLILLEVAWTLAFWPLESFSLMVILLSVAIVLLNIAEGAINKTITRISLVKNIGIVFIIILAVSLTTNWMMV